ncbi:MAG: hypothetical protein ACLR56_14105 [Oscillospiraceae bacterium]
MAQHRYYLERSALLLADGVKVMDIDMTAPAEAGGLSSRFRG